MDTKNMHAAAGQSKISCDLHPGRLGISSGPSVAGREKVATQEVKPNIKRRAGTDVSNPVGMPSRYIKPDDSTGGVACEATTGTDRVTVNEVINILDGRECNWLLFGVMLGISIPTLHGIRGSKKSLVRMLRIAEGLGLLTKERVVMGLNPEYARGYERESSYLLCAAKTLGIPFSVARPDCYSMTSKPALDDKISLRDAFLFIWKYGCFSLYCYAVEMGMPQGDWEKNISREYNFYDRVIEFLWQLKRQNLLTYRCFFTALNHVAGIPEMIDDVRENLALEVPSRQPDYKVFPDDRSCALNQTMSLRDLVDIVPSDISGIIVTNAFRCNPLIQDYIMVDNRYTMERQKIKLLVRCLTEKKGAITGNDILRLFYHSGIMRLQDAHRLEEKLTGRLPGRRSVYADVSDTLIRREGEFVDLKCFGLKLGIPEYIIIPLIQERCAVMKRILRKADVLDRLTRENLVYALKQSGNANVVDSISFLKGVEARELPEEMPVYLKEARPSEAAAQVRSVKLTMMNCGDLPVGDNWYWIGLSMGLSIVDLFHIGSDTPCLASRFYGVLEKLQNRAAVYETGHLYKVLCFLEDNAAIKAFPADLKGEPEKALATVAPVSSMGHALCSIAKDFSTETDIENFGKTLGLPETTIKQVRCDYSTQPKRIITELIKKYRQRRAVSRQELLADLTAQSSSLGKMMHMRMNEATDWTTQQAQATTSSSELITQEQRFQQNLRKAVLMVLDVPDEFLCPITQDLVVDPVCLMVGSKKQIFERAALGKWVDQCLRDPEHPFPRNPLTSLRFNPQEDIKEFPEVRTKINQWSAALPGV